jgi:hypothetical protein
MQTKPEALQDLSLVVAVVAAIDGGRWARLRAAEPWVSAAQRRRATWAELEPVLRPLLPEWAGADNRLRALRAGQLMAKIQKHKARELAAIDFEDVARAAGVEPPQTSSPQPSASSVSMPARVFDFIEKLVDGRASVRPALSSSSRVSPAPALTASERTSGYVDGEKRFPMVFTAPPPGAGRTSSPSLLDLASRPEVKPVSSFVPETEEQRIERESADRRARLEAKKRIVVTAPGGPAGNEGEKS